MSDFDNRDEEEKKETGLEENKGKEPSDKKEEKTDKPEKEYEDVCFICRRPERLSGYAEQSRNDEHAEQHEQGREIFQYQLCQSG